MDIFKAIATKIVLSMTIAHRQQEPIKKGACNFNAGRDEALSWFLWGVVDRGNDVTYPNKASFGASSVSKLALFEYVTSFPLPHPIKILTMLHQVVTRSFFYTPAGGLRPPAGVS